MVAAEQFEVGRMGGAQRKRHGGVDVANLSMLVAAGESAGQIPKADEFAQRRRRPIAGLRAGRGRDSGLVLATPARSRSSVEGMGPNPGRYPAACDSPSTAPCSASTRITTVVLGGLCAAAHVGEPQSQR